MRGIVVSLTSIFLTACAAAHMERGLTKMQGKEVETAFDVLGYPTTKREFEGKTVYIWAINEQQTTVIPQTNTTSGYVGTTPYYGQSTSYQAIPVNAICTIKIGINSSKRIEDWEFRGNERGCQSYANRLYHYYTPDNEESNNAYGGPPQP